MGKKFMNLLAATIAIGGAVTLFVQEKAAKVPRLRSCLFQILFVLLILSKELSRLCEDFTEFGAAHLADGIQNYSCFDGDETLWANETLLVQLASLKIGRVESPSER